MTITQHACARFKQRQNIKNFREMWRRANLALSRGTPLKNESSMVGTCCYLFGGFKYIWSLDEQTLITLMPAKQESTLNKSRIVSDAKWQLAEQEDKAALYA